jgi:hypothetical protein
MANSTPAGELAGDLARVLDLLRQVPAFQRPVGGAVARSLDRTFFLTEKATAAALGRKAPIAGPIETRRQLVAPVLAELRRCADEPGIAALLSDRDADLLPDDLTRAVVEQLARRQLAARSRSAPPDLATVRIAPKEAIEHGAPGHELPPTPRSTFYRWVQNPKNWEHLGIERKDKWVGQDVLVAGLLQLHASRKRGTKLPARALNAGRAGKRRSPS